MKKPIGILLAILSAVAINGLTLAAPAPASAESGSVTYASGGTKRPEIDQTSLWARNGPRRITVVLRVKDLTSAGRFILFVEEDSPEPWFGTSVEVFKRDGRVIQRYRQLDFENGSEPRRCAAGEVRWAAGRDFIRFRFPQSCFHGELPDRWQFGVLSHLGRNIGPRDRYDNPRRDLVLYRG